MAQYAISAEGADSLRALSSNLKGSLTGIADANKKLQTSITAIMDELGIYGTDIWAIILDVNVMCSSCSDEVEQLSEAIIKKSNEIEGLLSSLTSAGFFSQSAGATSSNVQTVEQIASWVTDINPNYFNSGIPPWEKNPYRTNCGSCALAVENHFLGDTSAVASIDDDLKTDAGMEWATGKKCIYMSVSDIESKLKEQGPGAHLIVGINRKPTIFGKPQAGHWFNAYYDGQNIYTVDGQIGQIMEWPHNYGSISEWCAMI